MTVNPIVLFVSVSIIKKEEVLMIKENKPNVINKWNFLSVIKRIAYCLVNKSYHPINVFHKQKEVL